MKKMISSDFLNVRTYFFQLMTLGIGVSLFVSFFIGKIYPMIPMMGCMVPFGVVMSLLAVDDKDKWDVFRLALPFTRNEVVLGRYAFVMLMTAAGVAAGLILTLLCLALMPFISQAPFVREDMGQTAFDGQLMLALSLIPFAMACIVFGIILPIAFRFGMNKTVRWAPLVLVAFFFSLGLTIELQNEAVLDTALNYLTQDAGFMTVSLLAFGVALLVYLVSAALSRRLYRKRSI